MRTELFQIGTIPAVLYGNLPDKDTYFSMDRWAARKSGGLLPRWCCPKGYQVLSIDLPGHGARQERGEELLPWTAVPDIRAARDWAERHWKAVSLRATSIGAYFAMLAFPAPERVLLVSPVLDMEGLIQTMMGWAGVTEDQLREQGEIATSFGQTLSWKYLCWVREHPAYHWTCPVRILYGSGDPMTDRQTVEQYVRAA